MSKPTPDIFFMTYKDWTVVKEAQRMTEEDFHGPSIFSMLPGVRQQPAETERRPDRVRSVRFNKLNVYDLAAIEKGIGPDWFWHHPHARPAWLKKHRPKKRFRGLFFYVAPKHRPAKETKQ